METKGLVKYVLIGIVAAVVASLAIFTNFGGSNQLMVIGALLVAGIVGFMVFKGKGMTWIPAGLVVGAAVLIGKNYVVPALPANLRGAAL